MRRVFCGLAIGFLFSTATANAQTVQLPSFSSFSVNTTVIAPDAGIATAGGVRRTGSSWRGYGPLPGGSMRSSTAATAGAGVHIVIHDFQELDDRAMAGSTPTNRRTVEHNAEERFAGRIPSVAEIRRQKVAERAAASATALAKGTRKKPASGRSKASRSIAQHNAAAPRN